MRLFVYCFLFIFITGNVRSEVNRECGGKIDVRERSGYIRCSFPSGVQPTNATHKRIIDYGIEKQPDVTCTWIIDARVKQTVWIEVISIDEDAQLWIKFRNDTAMKHEKGERALFTGTGKTTVEWSLTNVVKVSSNLNLRWNTSEDKDDLVQVPYTHSDSNPVSPSPDSPNRVTRTPNILGFTSGSPGTHMLWGVHQDREAGSYDKNSPFPQEITHNGQEKSGVLISNLTYRAATHTHSSYTHANSQTATQAAPTLAPPSAKAPSARVFQHNLARHQEDAVYGITRAYALARNSPSTGMHKASKIHPHTHNSIGNAAFSSNTVSSVHSGMEQEASEVQGSRTSTCRSGIKTATSRAGRVSTVVSSRDENHPHTTTFALGIETDRTNRYPRSTHTNQSSSNQMDASVFDDSDAVIDTSVSHNQANRSTFSDQDRTAEPQSEDILKPFTTNRKATENTPLVEHHTHSLYNTRSPNTDLSRSIRTTQHVDIQDVANTQTSHAIQSGHTKFVLQTSTMLPPKTTNQLESTKTLNLTAKQRTQPSSAPTAFVVITSSDLPASLAASLEDITSFSLTSAPPSGSTDSQDGMREGINSTMIPSTTTIPSLHTGPRTSPTVIPDLPLQGTVMAEAPHDSSDDGFSHVHNTETHTPPPTTESNTRKWQQDLPHTLAPQLFSTVSPHAEISTDTYQSTRFFPMDTHGNGNHSNSFHSSVSLSPTTPLSFSPSDSTVTGSKEGKRSPWTLSNDPVTPTATSRIFILSSVGSTVGEAVNTHRPWNEDTSQTRVTRPPGTSTSWPKPMPTRHQGSRAITPSRPAPAIQTHSPTEVSTRASAVQVNKHSSHSQTGTQAPSTAVVTQTSWLRPSTATHDKDWSHKGRVFIVEDQPAIIKVETFQVLIQVILERNSSLLVGLAELEPFLHRVAGYQNQQLTWHSGPVFQTVVTFQTLKALSWLGRVETLLSQAGLRPLPREGMFVGGVRVKNITVGGVHSDVCSWLFECPPGFQCVSSVGNTSCSSLCHSDYCRHHGICVHRPAEPPLCQCPVGEDFWYMGQRCDLRMTRQRLVGMCMGALGVAVALMALLSYLALRRFKSVLIQAKVDQTRSSYRRFNHFDELSARFWGRSWPGSEDSLANPNFTRSDELLHMRALDRTCCYHDDTLSIGSTYHGSTAHLSTVYPHSSQYRWNLSSCSLADCVIDSGKASDLSVCSWPIEPIQWTPFPLLQQLNRNTNSMRVSRPRSYCEGMELVDLEKSWTA